MVCQTALSPVFPEWCSLLCSVLDTVTIVLDTHAVYFYLVTNYSNPMALATQVWCVRSLCWEHAWTSISYHPSQECAGKLS